MTGAEKYRIYAADYTAKAEKAPSEELRTHFIRVATTYERLAESAERITTHPARWPSNWPPQWAASCGL